MWTAQRLEFEGADVQLFCRAAGESSRTKWLDQQGNQITAENEQYSVSTYLSRKAYNVFNALSFKIFAPIRKSLRFLKIVRGS